VDWKEIKGVYRSFRCMGEAVAAEQAFYRLVRWIYELRGEKRGREFMMEVVDPSPIIDWETGHEMGEDCPRHPGNILASAVACKGHFYLECRECGSETPRDLQEAAG
jgi:hypothetical protein